MCGAPLARRVSPALPWPSALPWVAAYSPRTAPSCAAGIQIPVRVRPEGLRLRLPTVRGYGRAGGHLRAHAPHTASLPAVRGCVGEQGKGVVVSSQRAICWRWGHLQSSAKCHSLAAAIRRQSNRLLTRRDSLPARTPRLPQPMPAAAQAAAGCPWCPARPHPGATVSPAHAPGESSFPTD